MATLGAPALRHALSRSEGTLFCFPQRRWAQVHDVRFVTTHHPPSRKVYENYKHKLDKKAKEVGVKDVDELKRIFLENAKPQSQSDTTFTATATAGAASPFPPSPQPPPSPQTASKSNPIHSSAPPGVKTLSSYLDLPKTLALPSKEIESLWRLRHASSPRSLCASVPTPIYRKIEATARRHPQFILPLPARKVGKQQKQQQQQETPDQPGLVEIHFLQWTFPTPETATVLFTHLAEYKLRGEYAQPHTTVTHHLEMAEAKGLVLLQGAVAEDRGVSVEEGRWLLMCLQKFYGGMGEREERGRLLRQFSEGDGGFRVEDLLDEAEKIL